MTIYTLEIYEAGSADDVAVNLQSSEPFGAILRGDLVQNLDTDLFARVSGVKHILWEVDGQARHKVCVYTRAAENTRQEHLT